MLPRREFLHMVLAAATASAALGQATPLAAQDRYDQAALLAVAPFGTVTMCHFADVRGQLTPHFMRPNEALYPTSPVAPHHLSAEAFRIAHGIGGGTPMDYALTAEDFISLAQAYGRMGGLDRIATVINSVRRDRPGALLLAGGQNVRGSCLSGKAVTPALAALGIDALAQTGVAPRLPFEVAGARAGRGTAPFRIFQRSGIRVAVIGQISALVDAALLRRTVAQVRAAGAAVVVWLSDNGIDSDVALAGRMQGTDVILSSGGHVALPAPIRIADTHIIASGGQGRFVSRIDLDVRDGGLKGVRHRLIPVFADLIAPDAAMARLVAAAQAPRLARMSEKIGVASALLYRQGTFESSWDNVICDALMARHRAQVALVPGFRWGRTILPGQDITRDEIHSVTAGVSAHTTVAQISGGALLGLLEEAAEAAFHANPYLRHGRDMVRASGVLFAIDPAAKTGARIFDVKMRIDGQAIDSNKLYRITSWGGFGQVTARTGPPIWDVLERYIAAKGAVGGPARGAVRIATR